MALKRVAIVQSNYIPWKGYFDLIASVDEFVLYDDAQYTRRDWRNRNVIKTPDGPKWLSVPVEVKGRYNQLIRETRISGKWAASHWSALSLNYRRARHFDEIAQFIEPLYLEREYVFLSDINATFLNAICAYLQIDTQIGRSGDYELVNGKSERLASICEQAGASTYVSGPAARDYLEEDVFAKLGIAVEWFDYSGYPEYPQLWGPFEHGVTVLDLIFNCGAESVKYMKYVQRSG